MEGKGVCEGGFYLLWKTFLTGEGGKGKVCSMSQGFLYVGGIDAEVSEWTRGIIRHLCLLYGAIPIFYNSGLGPVIRVINSKRMGAHHAKRWPDTPQSKVYILSKYPLLFDLSAADNHIQ